MHSATSSMLASSSAATSSVLKVRLVSSIATLVARSCSSRSSVRPCGHRVSGAVDPGGLLHRRLHLGADGGDGSSPGAVPSSRSRRRSSSAAWAATAAGADRRSRRTPPPPAGPGAEDQALGQRVGAQPVGAVDAHAGGLAGGVQARERRRAVDVGVDAAHHVVHDRADRDQLGRPGRSARTSGTARARTAAWCRSASRRGGAGRGGRPGRTASRGAALLDLVHERLREPVARAELHAAQLRRGRGHAEVVVLEVAVAVLVEQPAALGPGGLGDQDAGERAARSGGTGRTPCPSAARRPGRRGPCRRRC